MYNNILSKYYLISKMYYFHSNTIQYILSTKQRFLNVYVFSKLHLIVFNILFTIRVPIVVVLRVYCYLVCRQMFSKTLTH